jgi:outer membrane protein assembly factor BamA
MNLRHSILLLLPAIAFCQTKDTSDRVVLQELVITGVHSMTSSQLSDIEHSLTAFEVERGDEDFDDRLRNAFQERGYFDANVKSVKMTPLDPLAQPMPVRVESEIDEGPRYKLADFKFLNNRAISAAKLQSQFPLHKGDYFSTDKLRAGLEAVAKLYRTQGYVQEFAVPDTSERFSNAVVFAVDVTEGSQYRMGKLEIGAEAEVAQQLERKWKLQPGQFFDANYPEEFVKENGALLPKTFNLRTGANISLDCHDFTVSVQLQVDPDHPLQPTSNRLDCEPPNEPNLTQTSGPPS